MTHITGIDLCQDFKFEMNSKLNFEEKKLCYIEYTREYTKKAS